MHHQGLSLPHFSKEFVGSGRRLIAHMAVVPRGKGGLIEGKALERALRQ